MASNILEEFFIAIGVDSKDLKAGEKAVSSAVSSMQKNLKNLVGSFDDTTKKAGDSQNKLGKSTEKLGKDLQSSVTKVNSFFDSIKNNILALAGISLTMGGAMAWIGNTTKDLIELGVQSKALGISAKEVDGWGRAFKTAGSSAEAAMQSLKSIQDAKNSLAMGRPTDFFQNVERLNIATGTPQRIDWQNADAGAIQKQIAGMLQKVSKEQALYFGGQLGYDQAAIMGMRSGQIQSDQRKFTANSGVTDDQIEKAKRAKEAMEALNQKMDALKLALYEKVIPALTDLLNWINSHWGEISTFFMNAFSYIEGVAKAANQLAKDMGGWKNIIIAIIGLRFAAWLLAIAAAARGAMGAVGLLGKGGVVGAAAVSGYVIGTKIRSLYMKTKWGRDADNWVRERIAQRLAIFGVGGAKDAVAINNGQKTADAVKAGVKDAPVVAKKNNQDASEEKGFWKDTLNFLKAIAGNTQNISSNSGSDSGGGATASGSGDYTSNPKGVTRGERNNNPGNLNFARQAGARRENGSGRFAAFSSEIDGLKALYNQLKLHFTGRSIKSKQAGHALQTISQIITAWAPENENDTAAYIQRVSKKLGIGANQKLNFNDSKTVTELMKAIVSVENGRNRYSDDLYYKAIGSSSYKPTSSTNKTSNHTTTTNIGHVTVHSPATSVNRLTNDVQQQSRVVTANAFLAGSD